MPGSSGVVPSLEMRAGPSCTDRNAPTPWPVPWSKSRPACHSALPRQRVELRAAGADRKARPGERDMALEHAGEAVAHLAGRRADRHRAGDVGGAVAILRARIDQIERVGRDRQRGRRRDAVVDDRAVRAGAGNRVEGDVDQFRAVSQRGLGAECLQPLDRGDLVDGPGRPDLVEPGQEAHHRGAVADMGAARAGEFGCILARLRQGRPDRWPRRSCRRSAGSPRRWRRRSPAGRAAPWPRTRRARQGSWPVPKARARRRVRSAHRARRWRACARRRTATACPSRAGSRRRASPGCG